MMEFVFVGKSRSQQDVSNVRKTHQMVSLRFDGKRAFGIFKKTFFMGSNNNDTLFRE